MQAIEKFLSSRKNLSALVFRIETSRLVLVLDEHFVEYYQPKDDFPEITLSKYQEL